VKVKRNLWWLVLLLFIALFPATLGRISPYYNTVLILVGIYVILAVSLDLLIGFAGQISVGHAAFFALGAYTSGILTAKHSISPSIALLGGLFVSGLVAWGIGRAVLRLKGYYLAMATLGLNAVIVKLITGFASITGGASGLLNIPPLRIFGLTLQDHTYYYYFVWGIVILVITCCLALTKSPFGSTLIAIHSDEEAANTLGIDCPKYKLHVFVISSMLAGVAGSLFAHFMGFIAPDDFDIFTSILILVMLFLGGVGTIYGAALGAAFLKLLPEVTYRFQHYELFLHGLILILVLIFMPKGLLGILTNVKHWLLGSKYLSNPPSLGTDP
jgi:branched-chain amino acid transport system permease protein